MIAHSAVLTCADAKIDVVSEKSKTFATFQMKTDDNRIVRNGQPIYCPLFNIYHEFCYGTICMISCYVVST